MHKEINFKNVFDTCKQKNSTDYLSRLAKGKIAEVRSTFLLFVGVKTLPLILFT